MRVLSRTAILFFLVGCTTLFAQNAPGTAKQLGSIRQISGNHLTLVPDQGAEISVTIAPEARILRLTPGQTDLKTATVLHLSDLQPGDRILVRGTATSTTEMQASAVVVMKQQDIARQKQQELQDWQRRGIGGLVKQVDAAAGRVTLSVANKTVVVSTTPQTVCKRYSPNSVQWDDAKASQLSEIHPGDQLRARGTKNADGSELVAEEIVSGTFRNISGLVTELDAAGGTLTVQDLATKKAVTVRITPDSQLRQLSAQAAQGIAARLKGSTPQAPPTTATQPPAATRPQGAEINQLLARLPAVSLADLHKGVAVMLVSTEGTDGVPPSAITLLAGVEPILTASPSKEAQSFLTPWTLASAPGGDQ